VPDDFYFSDNVPLLKQYERCSGIPTKLAYILGKSIIEQIFEQKSGIRQEVLGQLMER